MAIGMAGLGLQQYYDPRDPLAQLSRREMEYQFFQQQQQMEMLRNQAQSPKVNPTADDLPKIEKSNPVLLLLEI